MAFRIATYNVNSIRARMHILLPWLEAAAPDVVCLQETKAQDADFPDEPLRAAGYDLAFCGEKSYNGIAILSREPLDAVRFGFDDGGPADETRLAIATVGGVTVVNSYVPQGREPDHPMFAYKLEWFRRLRRLLERHAAPDDAIVWVGDLNVAPEEIDVYDPKRLLGHVCFHPQATAALEQVRSWGFVDVFRKHVPDPGHYTYYDYRMREPLARNNGWRIDHILATHALAERSTGAWIDLEPRRAEKPSDHTPLLAEFAV